nr:MAG TPA: hypothetical protein [Caudoviricetes sp.]
MSGMSAIRLLFFFVLGWPCITISTISPLYLLIYFLILCTKFRYFAPSRYSLDNSIVRILNSPYRAFK